MSLKDIDKVAVFFASGEDMLECGLYAPDDVPAEGSVVRLGKKGEDHGEKTGYRVTALKRLGAGWDGISAVVDDRNWLEAQDYSARGMEDFFDAYSLAYDVGLRLDESPADTIVVEVEPLG